MFQIRDYVPGDSQRQIHWKLSHKYGKLIVKDPSLPITRSAAVFWERTEEQSNGRQNGCRSRDRRFRLPESAFPVRPVLRSDGTRATQAAAFSSKFATWTTSSACCRACLRQKRQPASAVRRCFSKRYLLEAGRI
ncbi:MAG: DUF58 domain-containing protein [Oscillospiraceae bacterium]